MTKAFIKQIGVLALIGVILVALAMWSESLAVNTTVETGELDWRFVSGSLTYLDACGLPPGYGIFGGNDWNSSYYPQPGAEQIDKDVGCTDVTLFDTDNDGDLDTMQVVLKKTYPWYYTRVSFKVHNDGTIPLKIWRVVINGVAYYELNEHELNQGVELDLNEDGEPDVTLWWGDNFGIQLHPCQSAGVGFDLTVLQPAPENASLIIYVSFEAIQWNEYHIPSG